MAVRHRPDLHLGFLAMLRPSQGRCSLDSATAAMPVRPTQGIFILLKGDGWGNLTLCGPLLTRLIIFKGSTA
jgi:hypothetical protein